MNEYVTINYVNRYIHYPTLIYEQIITVYKVRQRLQAAITARDHLLAEVAELIRRV